MRRMLTVVACGTRTIIDAVFGAYRIGETTYAPKLLGCLGPGMLLLADRNFAVTALIGQIASAHTDLLIRCKDARILPPIKHLPATHRGHYRLVTTLTGENGIPHMN